MQKILKQIGKLKMFVYLCAAKKQHKGTIAQLVEQRTENPCVPGSIPGGTTRRKPHADKVCMWLFYLNIIF